MGIDFLQPPRCARIHDVVSAGAAALDDELKTYIGGMGIESSPNRVNQIANVAGWNVRRGGKQSRRWEEKGVVKGPRMLIGARLTHGWVGSGLHQSSGRELQRHATEGICASEFRRPLGDCLSEERNRCN